MLKAKGLGLQVLQLAEGLELMLDFYRNQRVEGLDLEDDGDMLLYEWGCVDWGTGESFQVSLTRQFMDATGDDNLRQLELIFKYEPTATLRTLGGSNRWCESPEDIREFLTYIESTAPYLTVGKLKPSEVILEMRKAG